MSVDTYARKANMKFYEHLRYEGAEILVAKNLVSQAAGVTLELKKFLMFKWIKVHAMLYGHST
ncbi:MAG: hypothetical protein HOC77_06105 [Chloroflexi bacterium]|nr:hypothetical protein [Chloroflexota bacterium]MBT4073345.1 hypothetical protein [Chloroflexota bacterium]MBT4514648.1 hypothetical protein [Chloroflexota bacterium]MBT5320730.1 hypothetical protein [Chloroflexota bacterium]MBT6681152.1 hypothetical protein [Chloroflexota bacterium]